MGGGAFFFYTTETVNVMIHLFVSIANRIANHLIQNRISKTTLSCRPRVRIQPAEGDLFHMELKLLRNAQEYSPNIVAVEICRVRPFSAYFSRACGSSKIGPLPLRSAGAANTANTLFTRGGKSTKIFYSSKSTITLLKFYLSTSKSTSLKIYSSKSKK